jgi:hypothetical protein
LLGLIWFWFWFGWNNKKGLNGWAHVPQQTVDEIHSPIGMVFSLFTVGSYFNHSCNPNAIKCGSHEYGSLTIVKAQTNIKEGEEITLWFVCSLTFTHIHTHTNTELYTLSFTVLIFFVLIFVVCGSSVTTLKSTQSQQDFSNSVLIATAHRVHKPKSSGLTQSKITKSSRFCELSWVWIKRERVCGKMIRSLNERLHALPR